MSNVFEFKVVNLALGEKEKFFIGDIDKAWHLKSHNIEIIRVVRPGFIWLQIRKRLGKDVIRNWEVMQEIKNNCLGYEVSAIEVFPAQPKLRNKSHCRHLFAVDGLVPPDLNEIYKELKAEYQ